MLIIYARVYKNTKAVFTIGLMVFCWPTDVTQYNCSICLLCHGAIVCCRVTSLLCRHTHSRIRWIISIIQSYAFVNK